MSAHTPGPWRRVADTFSRAYDPYSWAVESSRGDDVALGPINSGDTHAEERANCLLVAAAPDLLAALERMVEHGEGCPACGMEGRAGCGCRQEQARAAIAKARGTP